MDAKVTNNWPGYLPSYTACVHAASFSTGRRGYVDIVVRDVYYSATVSYCSMIVLPANTLFSRAGHTPST